MVKKTNAYFWRFSGRFPTLLIISKLIVFLCIFYTVCPAKKPDAP